MSVKRIITNIATADVKAARGFYVDVLGLRVAMDHGWIVTFAAEGSAPAQISVATEGGAGTPVPDVSIEVHDLEDVLQRARAAGMIIEYGPVDEAWGVRRFFVRDPFGRLVNILSHASQSSATEE